MREVSTNPFASHFHFSPFPFFLPTLKRVLQMAKVLLAFGFPLFLPPGYKCFFSQRRVSSHMAGVYS